MKAMKLACLLALLPALAAAEPASVVRPTELKAAPATDAATVATLAENAAVEALERKGGWRRVKAGADEGWVRMLLLRFEGPGGAKSGDSGLAQVFNVARTGTSGTQVTTGTRGLDAEQLEAAKPDRKAFEQMAGYAAQPGEAATFAAEGGLSAQYVDYPAP